MSANIDSNLSTTTPLASHGSAVWVQLYYKGEVEGEDELFGEPIKIKPIPEDVSDLKEKVIEKAKTMLGVQVYNLKVYAPKTTVPIPKGTESVDSGEEVPADTTSKKPLIVIAPKPKQPNGKLRCCSRIHSFIQFAARVRKYFHSCLCCFQKDITVPNSLLPVAR
jgi:hypothetical protein